MGRAMLRVSTPRDTIPPWSHLMLSIVNQLDATTASLAETPLLGALYHVLSQQRIHDVVARHAPATRRCRQVPYELTVLVVIAMNLFAADALTLVLDRLLLFMQLTAPSTVHRSATKGAISQARARLGIAPLHELFHQVCRPLATPATPGACCFGLQAVALDSSSELVADTPGNERAFGRHRGQHGGAAFPQLLLVYLVDCATHAIFDVWMGPCHGDAPAAARRLLRKVTTGMLLLVDSGLWYPALIHQAVAQGAQVLGRVSSTLLLPPVAGCSDGSYLARLYVRSVGRRRAADPFILVRVIVYTLTDPDRTGYQTTHRLLTTLVEPDAYPARDLVMAYHERWEVEITIDEIDTHQRPVGRPLRSKTPQGVIQEVYGLLLAHYAVRALMHEAACQHGLDPDRISFVRAVGLILTVLPVLPLFDAESRALIHQRLLDHLARVPLPPRDQRCNPRVVKRRTSKFRYRKDIPPSRSFRQPFIDAIALYPMGAALLTPDAA